MQGAIKDKQREAYSKLLREGLPQLISNFSDKLLDDYSIEFRPFPLNVADAIVESGTEYIPVRAKCVLTNRCTNEVVEFNVDLLHLPVFHELGFKIHDNYMQMLDLYERMYGWSFGYKGTSALKKEEFGSLLAMNGKTISYVYDSKEFPYVSFKLTKGKTENISVSSFFRALTGYTNIELLNLLGRKNPYVISAFSGNSKLFPEAKRNYSTHTRNDCIEALAAAMFGKKKASDLNNIALKQREISNYLFNDKYLNLGECNAERFEYTQSYLYRAIGKTLAKDVECNGYSFEEGVVLTAEMLKQIDNLPITVLPVLWHDKVYELRKFSTFTFRALGYRLAEKVSDVEIEVGKILELEDLERLNRSNAECIYVRAGKRREVNIELKRRLNPVSLSIDDLFTAFCIWADNLNGFECYDKQYELTNRTVIPFTKRISDLVSENLGIIFKSLSEKLQFADTTDSLMQSLPDFTGLLNVDAFINEICNPKNRAGQMSDMCNLMSFVSKSSKATSNIKSDNVTPDLVSVQDLQEGRLDPFDVPESDKVGIVHHKTMLSKTDEAGRLTVPYLPVKNGVVTSPEPVYLTATEEADKYIAQWNETFLDETGNVKERVRARFNGSVTTVNTEFITYREYSPYQNMSPAHATIPFPGHSNGKRITMGCNMVKQAVPLVNRQRPTVQAGGESMLDIGVYTAQAALEDYYAATVSIHPELECARESVLHSDLLLTGLAQSGTMRAATFEVLAVKAMCDSGKEIDYNYVTTVSFPYAMKNYENAMFSYDVNPKEGNLYHWDDVIAYNNGYSLEKKEIMQETDFGNQEVEDGIFDKGLALVANLVVAYKTIGGSVIEDGITISDSLCYDDTLTSIALVNVTETLKNNSRKSENFSLVDGTAPDYFDNNGLPKIGTVLEPYDPVICKTVTTAQKTYMKYKYLGPYVRGQVVSTSIKEKNGETVAEVILAERASVEPGDKLAGRYGNKGVIARIVPKEQMPYDAETGLVADIILSPLGIPSRQNISQLLEVLLGMCMKIDDKIAVVSPYNPNDLDFVREMANSHGVHPAIMIDGRTGMPFERPINYGVISMYKLHHVARKKVHAIGLDVAVDPVFLQPRQGSKLDGGQSFSEMESWCLESIGATKVLQDLYSAQSDDVESAQLLQKSLESGEKWLNEDFSLAEITGTNHNDATMIACYRSLGVEFISNKEESCYEFAPITDAKIRSFSSMSVTHESALHSQAIFGNDGNLVQRAEGREKWGWIDLKAKIVNPIWIEKGQLGKLIRVKKADGVSLMSSVIMNDLIAGKLYLHLCDKSKRIVQLFSISEEDTGFLNISELPKEEITNTITGMDALVWIFENLDTADAESAADLAAANYLLKHPDAADNGSSTYLGMLQRCKLIHEFNEGEYSLKDYVISAFPVMPQTYRPLIEIGGRSTVPDFDWHYSQILRAASAVQKEHNVTTMFELYKSIKEFSGIGSDGTSKYQNVLSYFCGKNRKSHGKLREAVQSKRVRCSGRTTIIPPSDVTQPPTKLGVPFSMLVTMYKSPLAGYFVALSENYVKVSIVKKLLSYVAIRNKRRFIYLYDSVSEQCEKAFGLTSAQSAYDWFTEKAIAFFEGDSKNDLPGSVVLAGRQPSLHKYSIRAFRVYVVFDKVIHIHPLVCGGYNADFDGDQMYLVALLNEEAIAEALEKMAPNRDFIIPKNSAIALEHKQDIALGVYCATMLKDNEESVTGSVADTRYYDSILALQNDIEAGMLKTYDLVCLNYCGSRYLSTAGRILFNSLVDGLTDEQFDNPLHLVGIKESNYKKLAYDGIITSGKCKSGDIRYYNLQDICKELYMKSGEGCIGAYQKISEFGFRFSDLFGVSLSLEDLDVKTNKERILKEAAEKKALIERDFQDGLVAEEDKVIAIKSLYVTKGVGANDRIKKELLESLSRNNSLFIMIDSGARGNETQLMHMCGAIGILQKTKDEDLEDSVTSNYTEGLDSFDVHMASYSSRIGVASTQNETKKSGYATHQVVYMTSGVEVVESDCGKTDWWYENMWDTRISSLDRLIPTQEWFNEHLLGKVLSSSDLGGSKSLQDGKGNEITQEFYFYLKEIGGFHRLQFTDGSSIEITPEFMLGHAIATDSVEDMKLLSRVSTNNCINGPCLKVIAKRHLMSVRTGIGEFSFRYHLDKCCSSMLMYREARNLPGLEVVKNRSTGEKVRVITPKALKYIEEQGIQKVEARVMLDCQCKHGICAHCYGLQYSNLQLPEVGSFVGTESAQAVGEPAAQLTMSLINKGGVAGESIASGVAVFESLLDGNVPGGAKGKRALLAGNAGYVRVDRIDSNISLSIEPADKNCAMCQQCMGLAGTWVCPRAVGGHLENDPPCLISDKIHKASLARMANEWVDAGDVLTNDIIHPDSIKVVQNSTEPKKVYRQKQMIWVLNYFNTFKNSNIIINARHFELLAKVQNQYVTVTKSDKPEFVPGETYEYSEVAPFMDEVRFVMKTSNRSEVTLRNSGAFAALSFENTAAIAANLVNTHYKSSVLHNNSLLGSIAVGENVTNRELKEFANDDVIIDTGYSQDDTTDSTVPSRLLINSASLNSDEVSLSSIISFDGLNDLESDLQAVGVPFLGAEEVTASTNSGGGTPSVRAMEVFASIERPVIASAEDFTAGEEFLFDEDDYLAEEPVLGEDFVEPEFLESEIYNDVSEREGRGSNAVSTELGSLSAF